MPQASARGRGIRRARRSSAGCSSTGPRSRIFTLITTFVFAPYFANFIAADPVSGQAMWGYAAADRRPRDRAAVAGVRRGRGCGRPAQAVDRGLRRAADRSAPTLMWIGKPGDPSHRDAAADRLRHRHHRRGVRHRLQQRDDADAGAAGADGAPVRHRLGDRLHRRHHEPDRGAGLPCRRSEDRPHADRPYAAVRARSCDPRRHARGGSADRAVVLRVRAADVPVHAGPARRSGRRWRRCAKVSSSCASRCATCRRTRCC